jgi:glycosyltransferase involved in cell wall biosynthesis
MVLEKRKDTMFFIVGDARDEYKALEKSLHEKVAAYGIEENIVFTGFLSREKTGELLGSFDVFVLTSIQPEPFGLVVIEAMACGKAVVAPAEGGPLDIIEDGVSGMLVEPRNRDSYAEAILYLLENDDVRREMGRKARQRVEERFTIERTVSEIVRLYGNTVR